MLDIAVMAPPRTTPTPEGVVAAAAAAAAALAARPNGNGSYLAAGTATAAAAAGAAAATAVGGVAAGGGAAAATMTATGPGSEAAADHLGKELNQNLLSIMEGLKNPGVRAAGLVSRPHLVGACIDYREARVSCRLSGCCA